MADAKISELTALGATPADNDLIPIVDVSENPDVTKSVTFSQLMSSKFGGNSSDGALDTSGGGVEINLGAASYVEKNYSSINIATNNLTFTNPHANGTVIILRSRGNVTISSTLDASGMGAAAGKNGTEILDSSTHYGAVPTAGVVLTNTAFYLKSAGRIFKRQINIACGSGGGTGGNSAGGSAGGAGGRGGAALYIECAGALNFSGTISVAGKDGSAGGETKSAGGGGGGGGAGGMLVVLYNSLTANSGTINTAGGAGGKGGDANSDNYAYIGGTGGGGGGSYYAAGGAGGAGGTTGTKTGVVGSNAGGQCSGGGGGGGAFAGDSTPHTGANGGSAGATDSVLIAQNNFFL